MDLDGWRPDPFGIHEERLFRQGLPTPLVKDDGIGSYDKLPTGEWRAVGPTSAVERSTEQIAAEAIRHAGVPPTQETPVIGPPTKAIPLKVSRPGRGPSPSTSRRRSSGRVVVIVAIIGLLAAAVAIAYSTIPANSLPSLLGGRREIVAYRTGRAEVAAVVAIVLLVIAIVLTVRTRFPKLVSTTWHRLLGR